MAALDLIVKREDTTVIATLNRPGQLNALDKDIFDELESLMDVLETDKTVRCMIITGSGEKAFCVGADLKERLGMNEKDIVVRMDFVHKLYRRMEKAPFPVIAAINGVCLGGGLELALACDIRVASGNAVFGFPEVDLAIIPGNGGTQRLSRVVGLARALELTLTAKRLTAEEAYRIGLVHQVTAEGKVLGLAKQLTTKMQESGPIAIRQAKYAIHAGYERAIDEALQVELEAYRPCLSSKDRLEGLKAFLEKRKPVYQNA